MRYDGAELKMSGRAATNPSISGPKGDRVSFRAVSTERRYDEAAADWIDGDEFGTTVVCWGKLGASVLQLVRKGDPVIIDGRLSTRRFDRNGTIEYYTDCKADHVAIDVGRAAGRIVRNTAAAPEPTTTSDSAASSEAAASSGSDEDHRTDDITGPVGARDPFQDALGRPATPELEPAF